MKVIITHLIQTLFYEQIFTVLRFIQSYPSSFSCSNNTNNNDTETLLAHLQLSANIISLCSYSMPSILPLRKFSELQQMVENSLKKQWVSNEVQVLSVTIWSVYCYRFQSLKNKNKKSLKKLLFKLEILIVLSEILVTVFSLLVLLSFMFKQL